MKRNRNNLIVGCLLLSALLGACSKKQEPVAPKEPVKPPPAKPAAQPAALPAAVQPQLSSAVRGPGRLDFSRRTDPFKPFAPVAAPPPTPGAPGAQQQAARSAEMLPIQSFEVNKFKVIGIIAGFKENKALLTDPNGKGYVVQEGMPIGSSDGRVSRITPSSVEVVERFKDEHGRFKKRTIVLPLAKKR